MLTSAYPKSYLVKGISPEMLRGNEGTVYKPVAFIEVDGVLKWTFKEHWKLGDLREVKLGDERFLLALDENDYVGINEGENLYLMGENLYNCVSKLITEGSIEFSLKAWKPSVYGYHASVMTRDAFNAFRASLSYEIWPILEDFIVAGFSVRNDISELFDAYDNLIAGDKHNKQIHALRSGAFFLVSGEVDRLTFFSWNAVKMDKMFPSEEDFAAALDRYMHSLRALRLGTLT